VNIDLLPPRIASKIAVGVDADGCWRWNASITPKGYAQVRYEGRLQQAHRVVYSILVGPIPDGHELDHVRARGCTHRDCVNPDHLEPVTHRQNLLRGDTFVARQMAQTHCKRGHPFSTTSAEGNRRSCLACRRDRRRKAHG
jgi:hypothetical protein